VPIIIAAAVLDWFAIALW